MLVAGTEGVEAAATAGADSAQKTHMDITVIDHGRFAFVEFPDMDAAEDRPVVQGVHVVQLLPSGLSGRAGLFPTINQALQVGLQRTITLPKKR